MLEIYPYLYKTDHQNLFPGSSYKISSFLVIRPQGNVLIYNYGMIEKYFTFIEEKGGIDFQIITHADEATKICDIVCNHFNADLYCPRLEAKKARKRCNVDVTYEGDVQLSDDLSIIATPGHSPGSSCILWKNDNKNILFTGDTLYPNHYGEWSVSVAETEVDTSINTLNKLKELSIDVLVPAGFHGGNYYEEITFGRWQQIITNCISSLKAGKASNYINS